MKVRSELKKDELLSVESLLTDIYSPLFWKPDLLDRPSAWFGHIPFAHWIIGALQPSIFVELGTHAGVSYMSFCRAVERRNIGTRCYAVDTWKGDEQAGLYPEDVYLHLRKYNQEKYESFSTLLRSTFDEAIEKFEDGSIDLLHIDGFHSFEAVEHDFNSWKKKLSNKAVVLFHDVNEYKTGFGVWRFWAELKKEYSTFEFLHGHGLGVLVYGQESPKILHSLCDLSEADATRFRERFQFIGDKWLNAAQTMKLQAQYDIKLDEEKNRISEVDAKNKTIDSLESTIEGLNDETKRLIESHESTVEGLNDDIKELIKHADSVKDQHKKIADEMELVKLHSEKLESTSVQLKAANEELGLQFGAVTNRAALAEQNAATLNVKATDAERLIEQIRADGIIREAELAELRSTQNILLNSRSWRLTRPLRSVNARLAKLKRLFLVPVSGLKSSASRKFQYRIVKRSGLFDSKWYLRRYPDISDMGVSALKHYMDIGWKEGRDPSRNFDTNAYIDDHPDVQRAGINPLAHFVLHGKSENRTVRTPSRPAFDPIEFQEWIDDIKRDSPRNLLKKSAPLVSIVMPTKDRVALLPNAIDSVLRQTYKNWELIIVDDGSTDGTVEMLASRYVDKRIHVIKALSEGVSMARNKGLEVAKGSVFAYLDSDNIWVPEYLELMLLELARSKSDCVYAALQVHDLGLDEENEGVWYRHTKFSYAKLSRSNFIDLNVFIHKADLYQRLGGFDKQLRRMVDWELILRYTKSGSISYANFVGAHYDNRTSENRVSTREHVAWQNVIRNQYLIDWDELKLDAPTRNEQLVSIIICVYGLLDITEICLHSIFANEAGEPFEIILVDNGSDAATANKLKEWEERHENVRIVINPENYNFALGCNIGFAHSAGSRVVFLNNDTEVSPEWLRSLVCPLDNPEIKGTQPKLLYPDGTIQNVGIVFSQKSPMGYPIYVNSPGTLRQTNQRRRFRAITAACAAYRADDFIAAKGFDPIFVNGQEDVDICLRMGNSEPVFEYIPDSVVFHHESKTPGRSKNIESNRAKFYERWKDNDLGDDFQYYAEDGVVVADYQADNPAWSDKGYAVWRPVDVSLPLESVSNRTPLVSIGHSTIAIKIGCPRPALKDHWGDYHFAVSLVAAFMRHGVKARIDFLESWEKHAEDDDINLVLRGLSKFKPPQNGRNFLWLISHPDKVSVEELAQYEHIFVASSIWGNEHLSANDVSFEPLLQCTDSSRFYPRDSEPSIETGNLLVANSRMVERTIVRDAKAQNLELEIYGEMWESFVPHAWIRGQKIENVELPRYYSNADVVLNDHWETMRNSGFVSNRIFDVLACAGPLVTDRVKGFPDELAVYCQFFDDSKTLSAAIDVASKKKNPGGESDREIVSNYVRQHHSFDERAASILASIQRFL